MKKPHGGTVSSSYFDLGQYPARRQEKNLDTLLKMIQEIVTKHNDSEVLEECSRCLCYLCDEDNSIYIRCNLARLTIMDELVNTFNKAMDKMTEQNEVKFLIIMEPITILSFSINEYLNK